MLDQLQKALDTGGIAAFAAEMRRLNTASTAAAASQTRFSAIVGDPAVRNRLVELTRMNQLMQVQAKITRDQITLEARSQTVRSGAYAKQLTALRAIERQTRAVAREEERVRFGQRMDAVRSGDFRADDRADRELSREEEKVKLFEEHERLKNRAQDAKSGAHALDAGERAALARKQQMVALAEREGLVREGVYAEELKGRDAILRKQKQVEELERRAGYEARMGRRLGGLAANLDAAARNPVLRALLGGVGGAAMAAGAAATGGAAKGFQGTVEWNRLQLELQMVSRELAGAFLPAVQFATRELKEFRGWLEGMTPGQQNAVMAGGLALGGAAAWRMLGLGGLASVIGKFTRGASGLMQGGNWSQVPGAAPAKPPGGFRSPGRVGGWIGAGMAAIQVASNASNGYPDIPGRENTPENRAKAERLGSRDRLIGTRTAGDYQDERRREAEARGEPISVGGVQYPGERKMRTNPDGSITTTRPDGSTTTRPGANPNRRMATIEGGGFEASGSAFERITDRLARTGQDAGDSSESLLRQIRDLLAGGSRAAQATPRQETR